MSQGRLKVTGVRHEAPICPPALCRRAAKSRSLKGTVGHLSQIKGSRQALSLHWPLRMPLLWVCLSTPGGFSFPEREFAGQTATVLRKSSSQQTLKVSRFCLQWTFTSSPGLFSSDYSSPRPSSLIQASSLAWRSE